MFVFHEEVASHEHAIDDRFVHVKEGLAFVAASRVQVKLREAKKGVRNIFGFGEISPVVSIYVAAS